MRIPRTHFIVGCLVLFASIAMAGHGGGQCCCPDCGHKVCVFEPEVKKEKKHCWEVECKDICIPRFKWPWECQCDPPSCGKVKTVKVLKKKEYECEKCGYKWHVQTVCDGSCDPCCPAGQAGLGSGPCVNGAGQQPNAAPAPQVAPPAVPKPIPQARSANPFSVPPVTILEKGTIRTAGK